VQELTGDALEAAELYAWPGNVRQLRSELQRCAAIVHHAIGKRILTEGLDGRLPVRTIHAPLTGRSLGERVAAAERQAIEEALAVTGGHRDRAAALLGITRRTLQRKLAEARGAGRRLADPGAPQTGEPDPGDVKIDVQLSDVNLDADPKRPEELDSDGEGGVPCLV
jgi:DNA-binding NtrC family response regulator